MMDLDTRAQQAAHGLREAVASTELSLASPPADRVMRRAHRPGWSLAAGALAALVVMVGVWTVRPTVVADDVDEIVIPTSIPTTTSQPVASSMPTTTAPAVPVGDTPSSTTAPSPTVDVTPPPIEIISPTDGQVFEEKTITFAGTTEPGARVLAGPYEADVDENGNWSIVLILSPGTNRATFVAVDAAGNEASETVSPVYEPPVTTTTKPKEETKAPFTANFTFGECAEAPPYDVYYGKGEPGTEVIVTSEFGSGATVVGADGHWELRVEFPGAPTGKVFAVKVKDSLGRSKIFEFVNTGPK